VLRDRSGDPAAAAEAAMAEEAEIADAHEQATIQHESVRTCQCSSGSQ